MGIQLLPYDSLYGILNLMQNIIIGILVRLFIFGATLHSGLVHLPYLREKKPVFGLFFELTVGRFYPLYTVLAMINYVLFGPEIIRLLDTSLLRQAYQGREKQVFALAFLGFAVIYAAGNLLTILELFQLKLAHFLINFLAYYSISCTAIFHLFLLYYLQYSTYQNLLEIKNQIKTKDISEDKEEGLLLQFNQLAILNRRLLKLVAAPNMMHFFLSTFFSLVLVYLVVFLGFPLQTLAFPIINSAFNLHLVNYNAKICLIAEEIATFLNGNSKSDYLIAKQTHKCPTCHRLTIDAPASRLFHHQELTLYVDYFRLSFFNLVAMDRSFLLATCLLSINYMIFIYQT